jgi:hypothetical protein
MSDLLFRNSFKKTEMLKPLTLAVIEESEKEW